MANPDFNKKTVDTLAVVPATSAQIQIAGRTRWLPIAILRNQQLLVKLRT